MLLRLPTRPGLGPRKRARPSYSCVECTRRKLRCSKHIPCSACVERGIAQLCWRRPGAVSGAATRRPRMSEAPRSPVQNVDQRESPVSTLAPETLHGTGHDGPSERLPTLPASTPPASTATRAHDVFRPRCKIVDNVTEDAPVMLEFLALSRRRVLQVAQVEQHSPRDGQIGGISNVSKELELLLTPSQVRAMMLYHQDSIAWIHNLVHLPTFREQCERLFVSLTESQGLWLALYYAMLAVTLYHMDPSLLHELDIHSPCGLAELCYRKSMDSLNEADYMNNHSLFSLQAICLLIYVGHNIGQSDRISVLLAGAVRIAQCLCLHRLGPDTGKGTVAAGESQQTMQRRLIDREVSKRVWWFLVRQDWLQIPFNNTYTIHPSQFNTPMPLNCDEEIPLMFSAEKIIDHHQEHYTQGSYTMVLNHVAVLIWKTQDKMCQQGHPNEVEDGLRKLYSEIILADRELRELMDKMPSFYRDTSDDASGHPARIRHQHKVLSLALAHKFYSLHRHFQIPSFKDPWFAYTRVSCFPIMRRSLAAVLSLPPKDAYTSIVRNMWTINTHILTTAEVEIVELARKASRFLAENQSRSRIAKRGVSVINSVLEVQRDVEMGRERKFDLKEIVARVRCAV
ncbi:hypothetical protein BDW66DRAFT_164909 [Aspergillus desertorum]